MTKLSIRDLALKGQRVFMRVDFNAPIEDGRVSDDSRIRAALPTINYAREKGARLLLASHLGRPKGKPDPKYSLAPVAARLGHLLGTEIGLAPDSIGFEVRSMVSAIHDSQALMLENLRFHAEEEKNDAGYAKALAALCDVYVNDAFGAAHRAHASTEGITHYVDKSAAGLLMEKELRYLGQAIGNPDRPFIVILGGAKVSDKIEVIENLLKTADSILIGGAMAYTFLKSRGMETGKSLVEEDKLNLALDLTSRAQALGVRLLLPVDNAVVNKEEWDAVPAQPRLCSVEELKSGEAGLDIGPETVKLFADEIAGAGTIVWNGPMGVFERPPFDKGTRAIAQAVASAKGATIVGGGDSVAAVNQCGVAGRITHISTGGGASLEFLAGKVLPGVAALSER